MANTGTTFRRFCTLDEDDLGVPDEAAESADPEADDGLAPLPPPPRGRCVGLRLLVDGCRRGSVSCSVYASEWTNARVSCW